LKDPNIKTVVKSAELGVIFEIWAYRKGSEHEAQMQIALFLRHLAKKRKKLESGKTYGIVTNYH